MKHNIYKPGQIVWCGEFIVEVSAVDFYGQPEYLNGIRIRPESRSRVRPYGFAGWLHDFVDKISSKYKCCHPYYCYRCKKRYLYTMQAHNCCGDRRLGMGGPSSWHVRFYMSFWLLGSGYRLRSKIARTILPTSVVQLSSAFGRWVWCNEWVPTESSKKRGWKL